MNEKLEAWISECISKGTFANREDAIEFCVGATRAFCESVGIDQKKLRDSYPPIIDNPYTFPLKWSDRIESDLKIKKEMMQWTRASQLLVGLDKEGGD